MNRILVLSLLSISLGAWASSADVKVIYGEDNRLDVFEETDARLLELARSTAAMVPNRNLSQSNGYETELGGMTLEGQGICSDERFAKQPTPARCSGFLVGKNKLVTAGHCVRSNFDCKKNSWVFDFKVDYSDQSTVVVENTKIYKCKRVISRSLNGSTNDDYALIELERAVEDREPLEFRTEGAPSKGDKIVVIGHPSGLPTKIAGGAAIRSVNSVYFVANLDTYGGNSGSAVFNADTGMVEGILVRGEKDYSYDYSKNCKVSYVVSDNSGRGEDVTLITNIKELMPDHGQSDDGQSDNGGDAGRGDDTGDNGDNGDDQGDDDGQDPGEDSWWDRFLRWLLGED